MKRMLSVLLLCAMLLPMMSALSLLPAGAAERANLLAGLVGQSNDEGFTYEVDQIGMKYLTDGQKLIHEGTRISSWQSSYLPSAEVDVYIDFALDGTCILNGAALYPRGSDGRFFPEDYQILVSEDGREWKEVLSVAGDKSTAKEGRIHAFAETRAAFVRLRITKTFAAKASKGYVISLSELEIFGERYTDPDDLFTLNKEEIWMDRYEKDTLRPVMKDRSEGEFRFSSSDDSVATCDPDGQITAVSYGDTTVTVTDTASGVSRSVAVKVYDKSRDNITISVPMWTDRYVTEEQIRYLWEAEVDVITKHHNLATKDATDDTGIEDVEKMVEALRWTWENGQRGMRVSILTGELENALVKAPDEQIFSFAERYGNYPMLDGFHVKDEPYAPNPYARVVSIINENSAGGAMINFLPGGVYPGYAVYTDVLRDYAVLLGPSRVKSILSMDNYPFLWNSRAVDEVALFSNFEAIRRVGLETDMDTGYYIQGVGYVNGYRRPTEGDLTYHFSAGLAYGMKYISYYTWFVSDSRPDDDTVYTEAIMDKNGKPTELYEVAKGIHAEVHNVGPRLMKLDAMEVYHTGQKSAATSAYEKLPADFAIQPVGDAYAILSLMKDRDSGRNYVMLVNKDLDSPRTMTFTVQGTDTLYLLDKTQNNAPESVVALQDGKLTLTLGAGDFALYALPAGMDLTAPAAEGKNLLAEKLPCDADDSYSQDGWYFSKLTDGVTVSRPASMGWRTSLAEASVTYDLGSAKTFDRLDVTPAGNGVACGASFPIGIRVEVSDDGVTFREAARFTDIPRPTEEVPVFKLEKTAARFVRLTFTGASHTGVEICELAFYEDDGSVAVGKTDYAPVAYEKGDNVALGKKVFASEIGWTSDAEGLGYAFLTDGYAMEKTHPTNGGHWLTAWPSDYHKAVDEEVWVAVDLGTDHVFDRVNLYPRGSDGRFFPEEYDIQVSEDGEEWNTVKTVTGDTSTNIKGREIAFDEVEARFVRVLIRKHFKTPASKGYTTQISELEVIASRTVQPETEPDTEEETTPAEPDTDGLVEPDTPDGSDTDIPTEPADPDTDTPTEPVVSDTAKSDTDTPAEPTPNGGTEPDAEKPKSGCGSAMLSCAAILGVAAGAVALKKKKSVDRSLYVNDRE
ncbi:MAG: discoidin domain-containing protein [Clostridia bacterium]|nr:discoidin domain-containing protein [Clostridia bacterium]